MACNQSTIRVQRGGLDAAVEELIGFWTTAGGLSADEARRRLPELVCTLRCDGRLAGLSTVHAADVALIGGRRFWIYGSVLDPQADELAAALIRDTFGALAAEFDGSRGSPIGLCVLVADSAERRRRPEVKWSDPELIYAGYLTDGRQVRIGYFEGADVTRHEAYG
jgi:hypothetical protein